MWLGGRWIELHDMKRGLYAEGDGGEGAGDSGQGDGDKGNKGGGDDKTDITKMFTEFSTNTNKTLTTLMNEVKNLKKGDSTKALEAKLDALQAKIEGTKAESESESEGDGEESEGTQQDKKDVDPVVAEMRKELARLKAENKKHGEALTAAEQRREAAELKQRQGERDRQLADALAEAKAVNVRDAAKFLRSDVEWDEETGWYFLDGEDKLSITDGVEKFLPKYMREPATRRGGSGGRGTEMENTSSKAQLQEAAIQAGILAKKMRGADQYATAAMAAKRAAVEAGVDAQVIVRAVMAAPAA